jgi:hypothetical protein
MELRPVVERVLKLMLSEDENRVICDYHFVIDARAIQATYLLGERNSKGAKSPTHSIRVAWHVLIQI